MLVVIVSLGAALVGSLISLFYTFIPHLQSRPPTRTTSRGTTARKRPRRAATTMTSAPPSDPSLTSTTAFPTIPALHRARTSDSSVESTLISTPPELSVPISLPTQVKFEPAPPSRASTEECEAPPKVRSRTSSLESLSKKASALRRSSLKANWASLGLRRKPKSKHQPASAESSPAPTRSSSPACGFRSPVPESSSAATPKPPSPPTPPKQSSKKRFSLSSWTNSTPSGPPAPIPRTRPYLPPLNIPTPDAYERDLERRRERRVVSGGNLEARERKSREAASRTSDEKEPIERPAVRRSTDQPRDSQRQRSVTSHLPHHRDRRFTDSPSSFTSQLPPPPVYSETPPSTISSSSYATSSLYSASSNTPSSSIDPLTSVPIAVPASASAIHSFPKGSTGKGGANGKSRWSLPGGGWGSNSHSKSVSEHGVLVQPEKP